MVDPRIVLTGFKEWSSVIRALENGDQICLLRKGPRDESPFDLSRRRFWLVPTYAHQSEESLQPIYRGCLEETVAEREEHAADRIRLQSWVEARALISIRSMERLNWLTDHTVYSPRCLQERFQFQAGECIHLLIVRTYSLPDPRILEKKPEYETCARRGGRRWVQLDQRIPLQTDNPALDEAAFEEQKQALHERFVREGDDQPRPLLF